MLSPNSKTVEDLKVIDKYLQLKRLFLTGQKFSPNVLSFKIRVSKRTMRRYIKKMREDEGIEIIYNNKQKTYYLK